MSDKKTSSYQKGIEKLLEKKEGFEWIIASYLINTHNKFKSNVFPTTQIAKIVMNKMGKKKTQYPILHKIVREIFKIWTDEEICEIARQKRRESKKTKMIYRITDYGFTVLKTKVIEFSIQNIEGSISTEFEPSTRTREEILGDYLQDILDELDTFYDDDDEFDEEDEDEEGDIDDDAKDESD